jgi:O-acetyl-ADP-ribose deacetylase (regulator of RNase III)
MIYNIEGDLLEFDVPVFGHQANCQNTMGAGIAKFIKKKYPSAYSADCLAYQHCTAVLGNISVGLEKDENGKVFKHIINLYGQNLYGRDSRKTNYEAMYKGLEKCRKYVEDNKFRSIGFPYLMGCNLAGGSWHIVNAMIEDVFTTYDGDVYIVELIQK